MLQSIGHCQIYKIKTIFISPTVMIVSSLRHSLTYTVLVIHIWLAAIPAILESHAFFVKHIEWSLEAWHPNYQHYPKWNHHFTWPVQTMSELISLYLTSGEYSDQRWWLREVDWLRLCQGHRTSHLHFVWNSRLSALTENRVVGRKKLYVYIYMTMYENIYALVVN